MTQNCSGDVIGQIRELAFGRSNDAVKLLFLEPDQMDVVDKLDLRMVSEIKRGSGGTLEIKLVNRLALLELLIGLLSGSESESSEAESFFRAMDEAAQKLGDGQG